MYQENRKFQKDYGPGKKKKKELCLTVWKIRLRAIFTVLLENLGRIRDKYIEN